MTTSCSTRLEWEPFGPAGIMRGAVLVTGMALLLAGCGQGSNGTSSAPPASNAKPPVTVAPASAPASSAPAALPVPVPAAAASVAQAQQEASAAKAKLQSMSVQDLLAAARNAYAQHRLVAPAGDNAMEYYEAVLAQDPSNQVATDALRETFPFGVPEVEKAISQNDFDEAGREIDLLSKADPTNYTLTLLRSKLDAQRKLQARQQQVQLQAQQAAELAATQQAAAAKAAAEKEAAARQAAAEQQAAATAKAVAPPKPATPPPAPVKPAGETRNALAVSPAAPEYPLQAARSQTSGFAVVEFTVSADGTVDNPHVIDSSPRRVFDSAAIQAVRSSKFKPALKDGTPVASTLRRRIDFKFGG